jgi:hypothetical protein
MNGKRSIREIVCTATQFEEDEFPSNNLKEAIVWFQTKLATIPEQYQDKARCSIDCQSDCAVIEISYYRNETQAEIQRREVKELSLADYQIARDIRTFEDLQQKYGW